MDWQRRWLVDGLMTGACLAVISWVVAQAIAQGEDEERNAAVCSGNVRQLGVALTLYTSDYDGYFPLAMSANGEAKTYRWNEWHPFSSTLVKSPGHGYDSYWVYALVPYVAKQGVFACPSGQAKEVVDGGGYEGGDSISYTYNGLLNGFDGAGIVAPSALVVIWEGMGSVKMVGYATAQPTLRCVSIRETCRYQPYKAPIGVMFRPLGTMKIHDGGLHMGFADSHVTRRKVGLQVTSGSAGPPFTDPLTDPFTGYSAAGVPGYYFTDGFHPWLFRPSYDFSDRGSDWPSLLQVSAVADGPVAPK